MIGKSMSSILSRLHYLYTGLTQLGCFGPPFGSEGSTFGGIVSLYLPRMGLLCCVGRQLRNSYCIVEPILKINQGMNSQDTTLTYRIKWALYTTRRELSHVEK